MASDLIAALEEARRGLLDLSTRNRLLALPAPGRARGVLLLDEENATAILAKLKAAKPFGFEAVGEAPPPKRGTKAEGVTLAGATPREEWQQDNRLRVRLPPAELARKLRDIIADARTAREESGVPSLFLALGALAWRDPGTPQTERLAPLILIPATIEREGVSNQFRLRANAEEAAENLSLREKLASMGLELPEFEAEDYDPSRWADAIATIIAPREGWRVQADTIAIGLFSFGKFLMWRDLSPQANPGLAEHPLVRTLVGGEPLPPQPAAFADDADVDEVISVERLDHVVEVDGSQALATELARRGGHVVIQGPPGTGKSQSICNILAQAVLDGRSVLFVAEKLAALEVVQRRLTNLGLGAACLELHSEKQSKRAVLDELRATLALPMPPAPDAAQVVKRLGEMRGRLNRHAAAMRAPVGNSAMALHLVLGGLVALRQRGVAAPPFSLPAPDAGQIQAWRDAARELAARAAEGGAASVWQGVTTPLDATATERLLSRLPGWIRSLAAAPGTPTEAEMAIARAEAVAAALGEPPPEDGGYQGGQTRLEALCADLALLAKPDPRIKPEAWRHPGLDEARATLAEPGGIFGFLSAARRAAQACLAEVAQDGATADPLPVLDAALALRAAAQRLDAAEPWARIALGEGWRHGFTPAPPSPIAPLRAALAACAELRAATGFAEEATFQALAQRLTAWASEAEALQPWLAWQRARQAAPELAPLALALAEGSLPPEAASDGCEYAMLEALLRLAMRDNPALAAFDGTAMDRVVEDFRTADAARVTLARAQATHAHAQRLKRVREGEVPGLTVLRGEMEKRRGHLPVRELLLRAAPAIQAAKPIFMMSPLSVAQFLAPPHGLKPGLSFDLLVMDEASQIEPVDALGAIARCRQMVVVGDDKQMPPTRFFQRMMSDEEEAPETASDTVAAREVESILGLANARGVPNAMLRWHYRSRHESLIATSNQEFYGNRLLVLPSPRPRSPALGLSLVRVEGSFDSGGTGTNAIEAAALAAAVIAHARTTPGDTLGVATFSIKQRDAIIEALEELRRQSPDTEAFFTAHPAEPFFIKNLENVQGDERDSILISVGYGRDARGRLAMRFGPLSAEGGERRLNVLITRAKKRCIVFSGIGAEEIDLERATGRGVAALKTFLAFAAQSGAALRAAGKASDSPLGAAIARVVEAAGKRVVQRVGLSGLFLDVAAAGEAGFELGVETDGADWAALRCARDRDRGRQAALAGMGWKLARSWSLDWLNRPAEAEARLRAALGAPEPPEAILAAAPETGLAQPYIEAAFEVPRETAIADMPFASLAECLARIIGIEAPVHGDVVMERARLLWGAESLSAAERSKLQQALRLSGQLHGVQAVEGFWSTEAASPAPIPRDRRASIAMLRRPAMLPPAEVEAAALALQAAAPTASEVELAMGLTRMLGLEATAAIALQARLAAMVGSGRLKLLGMVP